MQTTTKNLANAFGFSIVVTLVCLGLSFYWGGWSGVYIAAVLGVLEVSLSFDNAVVNASVLKEMSEKWQKIFLTVGILIAVVGMRLVLPVLVVALAADVGLWETAKMALYNPEQYSHHLNSAHIQIAVFGGVFLLLVFFDFIFGEREHLWLGPLERLAFRVGKVDSISVVLSLGAVLAVQYAVPEASKLAALLSGIFGIILFILVQSLDQLFSVQEQEEHADHGEQAGQADNKGQAGPVAHATRSGIMGFLYLEVLDASFSFDGVIGAFAITKDVVIIMLGLAIGAMFVRSMTVYLVKQGTLGEYIYLEHGAHYAIGILGGVMMVSTVYHIPEWITSLVGVLFIVLSVMSSIYEKKKQPA
jgi:hypothetical protein